MPTRRSLLAGAGLLATPAFGQAPYPDRPIRCLIPWPPGGALDALHRQMFEIMARDLGQQVLIENRPGARGTQAAIFLVNQARPDGYTIAHHHLSIIRHPFLTKAKTWDPVADFTYIMQLSGFLFGTAVRADAPWKSFAEMMAAAKAEPGKYSYSTSGIATTNHLAMEDILEREGGEMLHIPYRGSQEGVTALLGRQISCVADSASWLPNVEAGELRLLSVWKRERLRAVPQAPTLMDLGYNMVVTSPYGFAGPKGMEPEIVDKLHRSLKKAMEDPASQAIIDRWEMPREYLGPADYLAFATARTEYERTAVAKRGLSID